MSRWTRVSLPLLFLVACFCATSLRADSISTFNTGTGLAQEVQEFGQKSVGWLGLNIAGVQVVSQDVLLADLTNAASYSKLFGPGDAGWSTMLANLSQPNAANTESVTTQSGLNNSTTAPHFSTSQTVASAALLPYGVDNLSGYTVTGLQIDFTNIVTSEFTEAFPGYPSLTYQSFGANYTLTLEGSLGAPAAPTPEPASLWLLLGGLGVLGFAGLRRRRAGTAEL